MTNDRTSLRRPHACSLRVALLVPIACALSSCGGGKASPPPPGASDLGGLVAAKVGDQRITTEMVARVARAQGIAPARARDALIEDAVLAAGARGRGIDPWFETDAILPRRLSASLQAAAEARGPVTDAELDEGTQRYWLDVDRPAGIRVVQMVVLEKPEDSPQVREKIDAYAALLEQKAKALHDLAASTSAPAVSFYEPLNAGLDPLAIAFHDAVNAVPRETLQVSFELEPPVAADDRMLEPHATKVVPEFTRGIAALHERGDVAVFRTSFGVHVTVLLDLTPAAQFSREERRRKLRDVVIKDRARAAETELLARLRPEASIERHAEGMLADVVVAP